MGYIVVTAVLVVPSAGWAISRPRPMYNAGFLVFTLASVALSLARTGCRRHLAHRWPHRAGFGGGS